MSSKKSASGGGIGILGLLGIVFVTLKLCEVGAVAHWSWWWVTCPFWAPIGLGILILGVAVLLALIGAALS